MPHEKKRSSEEKILQGDKVEKPEKINSQPKSDDNTKKLKSKIKELKSENKTLSQKAINNALEIHELKKEIKRINQEYVDKAKSFAAKAQIQLNNFKEIEQAKNDQEIKEIKKYALQKTGEDLIDVLNQLNRVISFKSDNAAVNNYVSGFRMITQNFNNVLNDAGLKEISVKVGDKFDSHKHEAIEVIDTDNPKLKHHIAEVIHSGYHLHDRLIKPVLVKIYK